MRRLMPVRRMRWCICASASCSLDLHRERDATHARVHEELLVAHRPGCDHVTPRYLASVPCSLCCRDLVR